ncbi:MAG: hypothetical protein HQK49_22740 [Oligoflexia bacterium]|nr:hypothetical protein [Oligoflexia bacterium]
MNKESFQFGPITTQFFAWIQAKKINIVKQGDVTRVLNISDNQERTLLYRLNKSKLIIRLFRGIYLVPDRIPPGGKWSPDRYIVLFQFIQNMGIKKYQVTGLEAFNRHGFTSQIPQMISIYNDKISGIKTIAENKYQFIKVTPERIGNTIDIQLKNEGDKILIGSMARIIFDAIYDYYRFSSLPDAYDWLIEIKKNKEVILELVNITCNIGNVASKRRVGFIIDKVLKLDLRITNKLSKSLTKNVKAIQLVPNKKWSGKIDRKWGIIDNV